MEEGTELHLRVARIIRRLRSDRGWSQEEFAAHCGLHRTYIGAIERGEYNVTIGTLDKLAVALGIEPWELLKEDVVFRPTESTTPPSGSRTPKSRN